MENLKQLEQDSLSMIRSIPQLAHNPAVLWSTGKDSTTMLYLIRKVFECVPWPVIHLDTERKFKEIYEFRNRMALQWGLNLIIAKNEEALKLGIGPEKVSRYTCCTLLKTDALKDIVQEKGFDALILSIRHDEHYVRGMEDLMSLRDEEGNWKYWGRYGGFNLTAPEQLGYAHIRIHPILPWTEAKIWEYVMQEGIPYNPLYIARKNEEDGKWYRYRSLGCVPCTEPAESKARTIQEIVSEVYQTPGLERAGRAQDKECEEAMLKLRAVGYM